MQSLTTVVLILGVIAVVVTWITAVRIIKNDAVTVDLVSPGEVNDHTRHNEPTAAISH